MHQISFPAVPGRKRESAVRRETDGNGNCDQIERSRATRQGRGEGERRRERGSEGRRISENRGEPPNRLMPQPGLAERDFSMQNFFNNIPLHPPPPWNLDHRISRSFAHSFLSAAAPAPGAHCQTSLDLLG